MEGRLQKKIDSSVLACVTCIHFRNDHIEDFYCYLKRKDFPALCVDYQYF
jgi:hypothetical protein